VRGKAIFLLEILLAFLSFSNISSPSRMNLLLAMHFSRAAFCAASDFAMLPISKIDTSVCLCKRIFSEKMFSDTEMLFWSIIAFQILFA
jgi:hypothetical protein